jgi:hypothetical protein
MPSKCTTINTLDDLPSGDTAIQYTTTTAATLAIALDLATVVEQAGDPTAGAMSTGDIIVSIASGDLFYKSETGLYTIAGAYAADA